MLQEKIAARWSQVDSQRTPTETVNMDEDCKKTE